MIKFRFASMSSGLRRGIKINEVESLRKFNLQNNFTIQIQAYDLTKNINRKTQPTHAEFSPSDLGCQELLRDSDRCYAHISNIPETGLHHKVNIVISFGQTF